MGQLLFFNRVRDEFDSETRKTVVESIALSAVNDCLPLYGITTGTLLSRVQQLQNFAAKICAGRARRSDHATPILAQLKWLKMDKKVIFDVAVHVYKIKIQNVPRMVHAPSPRTTKPHATSPQLHNTTSTHTTRSSHPQRHRRALPHCLGPQSMEHPAPTRHRLCNTVRLQKASEGLPHC